MGGCCSSSRTAQLHGMPIYYYCSSALEEDESLTASDGAMIILDPKQEWAAPRVHRMPPMPLPFDAVLDASTDSAADQQSRRSNGHDHASSLFGSQRKFQVSASNELNMSAKVCEDVCPICLEDYDEDNPKNTTSCQHHFHLPCILEWMEKSDVCPICGQEMSILSHNQLVAPY